MHTPRLASWAAVAILLLVGVARETGAATITFTAIVSDRGRDDVPWDGIGAIVYNNPSVVQITTPPLGVQPAFEERTAVEFPLGTIPPGSSIDSVTLRLSPFGDILSISLGAGEVSEIHGYAGDGLIQVADLMDATLVATIVGPAPSGPLLVPLAVGWFQSLIDADSAFAGLMFKGVPGPIAVVYTFDSAFSAVPLDDRPTLSVEYHEGVIPEPGTFVLIASGLVALVRWRRRACD